MRFMAIVKASAESEAGIPPSQELLAAMGAFNEEMVRAGVLVDANGLLASSKGARVKFSGDKRTVIDGPFAEAKELVAGYWILEVKSKEEAVEWIRRCPNPGHVWNGEGTISAAADAEVEIRQVSGPEDFGEAFTPEMQAQEARMAAEMAARHKS
ncbi:MAG: YciI family protein [Tepidiformaceae bacterium]